MKKRSLWIAVLLLCVCACLWAVACKKNEREVLATPQNLKIENEYLTWDEIENATGYTVDINGEFYETESNSLDIFLLTTEVGTYEMKVVSMGDGEDTIDSDWSETIEYSVSSPVFQYGKLEDETGCIILAYKKDELKGKLVVPSEIDGLPVVGIPKNGFSDCTKLESVILPDSLVELGRNAFSGCTSLARIALPDDLQAISGYCFSDCTELESVILPDSIVELGSSAFLGCTSLKEIDLPSELKDIASSCFMNCEALTEIKIPAYVAKIYRSSFLYCDGLTSIQVDEANSTYRSENNCLIKNDGDVLVRGCKTSVIPKSVKEIGDSAFYGCVSLTKITIPESVKEIGYSAFYGCVSLMEITIPKSVKEIGNNAFNGCVGLTKITVPGNVKKVGMLAFYNCQNLQEVIFEEGVQYLGTDWTDQVDASILSRCPSLRSVAIPSTVEWIPVDLIRDLGMNVALEFPKGHDVYKMDGNCLIRKTDNVLISGRAECTIPDYVTGIGDQAFRFLAMPKDMVLPTGITRIGNYAFAETTGLERVVLPTGITRIGNFAFSETTGLERVVLPLGLKEIGAGAFMDCKDLKYVNIPPTVTEIGGKAFCNCYSIDQLLIPDSVQTVGATAFGAYSPGFAPNRRIFEVYTTHETIPAGWEDFGSYSTHIMYGCTFGEDNGELYVETWKRPILNETSGMEREVITRKGYTFKGWALEENSDEIFIGLKIYQDPFWDGNPENGKTIMDLKPYPQKFKDLPVGTVLYAVWEKNV